VPRAQAEAPAGPRGAKQACCGAAASARLAAASARAASAEAGSLHARARAPGTRSLIAAGCAQSGTSRQRLSRLCTSPSDSWRRQRAEQRAHACVAQVRLRARRRQRAQRSARVRRLLLMSTRAPSAPAAARLVATSAASPDQAERFQAEGAAALPQAPAHRRAVQRAAASARRVRAQRWRARRRAAPPASQQPAQARQLARSETASVQAPSSGEPKTRKRPATLVGIASRSVSAQPGRASRACASPQKRSVVFSLVGGQQRAAGRSASSAAGGAAASAARRAAAPQIGLRVSSSRRASRTRSVRSRRARTASANSCVVRSGSSSKSDGSPICAVLPCYAAAALARALRHAATQRGSATRVRACERDRAHAHAPCVHCKPR
jgi:hypothetical protein